MDVARVAKVKQDEREKEYYDKYIGIYDTAIAYLKERDILLYGGLALDQYMPDHLKIYSKHTLPDIDMFSSTAKKLANDLAAHLKRAGYKLVNVGTAISHDSTFKVFAEGLPIADVSQLSSKDIERLGKGGRKGSLGLPLVGPEFIRFTLHAMLGTSSIERWEKVASRMVNFYKVFAPVKTNGDLADFIETPSDELASINNDVHVYTESSTVKCVLLGTPVISMMLGRKPDVPAFKNVPYNIAIVDGNPLTYAKQMVHAIGLDGRLAVSHLHKANDILIQPEHVIVTHKKTCTPVAILFHAKDKCFGYNEFKGRYVATIHVVLMIYMSMLLNHEAHFAKMSETVECIVNALSRVQRQAKRRSKILTQFSVTCLGTEHGLATLRRKRFGFE